MGLCAQNVKKFGIEKNDSIPVGLAVGKQAPAIEVLNAAGEQVNPLNNGDQYHVVVFYRGNWCSYCNRYLNSLNDSLSAIRRAGGSVIAITHEPVDEIAGAAVFLASAAGSFTTGQTIVIDGGGTIAG